MKNEEIFEIVDLKGNVLGKAKRSEVHGNPGLVHRVVHCLVFNRSGELYLQKRSMNKDVQPGKWDTSVGGHVMPNENIIDAVRRETKEELGISVADFTHLYQYVMANDFETELVDTFRVEFDGKISINEDEISQGRFWSFDEINKNLKSEIFTPNFEDEWEKYNKFIKKELK